MQCEATQQNAEGLICQGTGVEEELQGRSFIVVFLGTGEAGKLISFV